MNTTLPTGSAGILDGIKVLDLTRVLAGPWCTQALADMGATVWKIERPEGGDEMRLSPPHLKNAEGKTTTLAHGFLAANRGKHSITLDFTRPEGQRIVQQLAAQADVVVENFKVGDLARYGLDYQSLRRIRPDIIYCSITGYGQDGPLASQPGYDPVFQAVTGIMSVSGHADGEPGEGPMRCAVAYIDVTTGMVATSGILGALFHRSRTGQGQSIDVALLDTALAATTYIAQKYVSAGIEPRRAGNGSLLVSPSGTYPCADGRILIHAGSPVQWERLCQCLGKPEWVQDPRFADRANRLQNFKALDAAIGEATRGWNKQALSDALGAVGVPAGPVNSMAEAFQNPQVRHRNIAVPVSHPGIGEVPMVHSPFRFSETPVKHRPVPELGADTARVLADELGLDTAEIERLRASKIC